MISTVTTTTVTTVAALGISAALGGVAVIALIFFLVQREFASAAGPRFHPFARSLAVAIVPLLVTFVAIVVVRLAELLQQSPL